MSDDQTFYIRPRDPLVFRDGRPFGGDPGARAYSLPWPFPGTLAGAIRTRIGEFEGGGTFQPSFAPKALNIPIQGPLLGTIAYHNDGLAAEATIRPFFPAPLDAFAHRGESGTESIQTLPVKPVPMGPGGWDLDHGILPTQPMEGDSPFEKEAEVKAATTPTYWSLEATVAWLHRYNLQPFPPREATAGAHHHPSLLHEARTHVAMDSKAGTPEPGLLFQTDSLRFRDEASPTGQSAPRPATVLLGRARSEYGDKNAWIDGVSTFGGERRIARWRRGGEWPSLTSPGVEDLIADIGQYQGLRVQLVTPGIFPEAAWHPDFLEKKEGYLEGPIHGALLRLRAAIVPRWEPVSGWDYALAKRNEGQRGEKAIRRLVQPGSVYFFEVLEGDAGELAQALFMGSLCAGQEERDGYGLCVPGVWDPRGVDITSGGQS